MIHQLCWILFVIVQDGMTQTASVTLNTTNPTVVHPGETVHIMCSLFSRIRIRDFNDFNWFLNGTHINYGNFKNSDSSYTWRDSAIIAIHLTITNVPSEYARTSIECRVNLMGSRTINDKLDLVVQQDSDDTIVVEPSHYSFVPNSIQGSLIDGKCSQTFSARINGEDRTNCVTPTSSVVFDGLLPNPPNVKVGTPWASQFLTIYGNIIVDFVDTPRLRRVSRVEVVILNCVDILSRIRSIQLVSDGAVSGQADVNVQSCVSLHRVCINNTISSRQYFLNFIPESSVVFLAEVTFYRTDKCDPVASKLIPRDVVTVDGITPIVPSNVRSGLSTPQTVTLVFGFIIVACIGMALAIFVYWHYNGFSFPWNSSDSSSSSKSPSPPPSHSPRTGRSQSAKFEPHKQRHHSSYSSPPRRSHSQHSKKSSHERSHKQHQRSQSQKTRQKR